MDARPKVISELVDTLEARSQQRRPKILVVGDVMLDEYIFGTVDRISPEAPIPVVECESRTSRLGGAANVAANLAAFGAEVCLLGVIGEDHAGDGIGALMAEAGLSSSELIRASTRPTTHKLRVVAAGQQVVRVDFEQRDSVGDALIDELAGRLRHAMTDCAAVVISDYGKGVCTRPAVAMAIEEAGRRGLPILCDPKGPDYRKYAGATLITPNRKEASEALASVLATREALAWAARQLTEVLGVQRCLITLGPEGMLLTDETGSIHHIEPFTREVSDVTGAGDTVIGMMAFATSCGLSLHDAALLANAAAAIVVGKIGSSTVTCPEIRQAYCPAVPVRGLTQKLVDLPTLLEIAHVRRTQGESIVFTNGCFDLLHAGHVDSLERASSFGDMLVVGLNSDASVRRLKGARRPVMTEADRALLLSAMSCVDYVVIFDEDTPETLINALAPDVLVKGADYAGSKVVGEETVLANGGRLELLPLKPGHSTTSLISSIMHEAQ